MKDKVLVFYANQLYGDYAFNVWGSFRELNGLPDGSYIRAPHSYGFDNKPAWYLSDFTPVLEADIPKELLVLVLLLT